MSKEWWQDKIDDVNGFLADTSKISSQVRDFISGKISNYQSTINFLGLGVYDGLLAEKLKTNTTSTKTIQTPNQIVHSDEAVKDEFAGTNGVYYVNYANIYNTLNRNIGGNSYMSSGYDILDEGEELGQRSQILFDAGIRPQPTFISDAERDAYVNYLKYMNDYFGDLNYNEKSILAEKKGGYNVGVVRDYTINGSSNPNSDTDTLLGKMSSAILGNIITQRNIRRSERGFPSITNINYYDKGRLDIEKSENIESLDTAMGVSSSPNLPNFGIKSEYALVEFGDFTLEYEYSARTQNYSLFDAWGELTNATISLSNSPAYNSMNKSVKFSFGDDSSTLYLSADKSLDISQFLIQNLKYKGGLQNSESFVTYFGKHNFDVYIDGTTNKSRYVIYTNGADDSTGQHVNFHYDEGAITEEYGTANAGVNFGSYLTYKNTNNFGKDLLNVTNNAFRNAKYNTIISKFYTNYGQGEKRDKTPFQSAVSKRYGMSHGRNLLKTKPTNETGYENPYCRVWTYHHQYSRLCDTIRPFTKRDGDDINCSFDASSDVRQYINEIAKHRNGTVKFTDTFDIKNRKAYQIVSSQGQTLLAENSVINKYNGLVNITPTTPFEPDKQVKTKNCMFSIENLAWKDIEKDGYNLADDQIGPLGGRIMWFPPYGLTFNENVNANWNAVSFIGRGENMYTYTNTERSGSLSFIMLIDHPSILNEWNKEEGATSDVDDIQSTEQKILRFFAGCELLEPLAQVEDEKPKSTPPPQEEPITEPHKGHFSFCVYFPNNYTGNLESEPESAVSYLLNGFGYGLLNVIDVGNYWADGDATVVASAGATLSLDYNILKYKYYDTKNEEVKSYNEEKLKELIEQLKTNTENSQGLINDFLSLCDISKTQAAFDTMSSADLAVSVQDCSKDLGDKEKDELKNQRQVFSDSHRPEMYAYQESFPYDKQLQELYTKYLEDFNAATTDIEKNNLTNTYNYQSKQLQEIRDSAYEGALQEYNTVQKPIDEQEEKDYYISFVEKYYDSIKKNILQDICFSHSLEWFTFDPTILQSDYKEYHIEGYETISSHINDAIAVKLDTEFYGVFDKNKFIQCLLDYENGSVEDYNLKNIFSTISKSLDYENQEETSEKTQLNVSHFDKESVLLGGYEMSVNPNYGITGKKFGNNTDGTQTYDAVLKDSTVSIATIDKYKSKFYEHHKYIVVNDDESDIKTFSYFLPKHGKTDEYVHSWGYRVDEGSSNNYNPFNDSLSYNLDDSGGKELYNACVDSCSYGLNALGFYENKDKIIKNHPDMNEDWENMYSFADVFAALQPEHANDIGIKDCINKEKVEVIRKLVSYGIAKIKIDGVASVQGTTVGTNINSVKKNKNGRNNQLSKNRGEMIQKWLKKQEGFKDLSEDVWPEEINIVPRGVETKSKDVSAFEMKNTRCAIVTIDYDESISIAAKDSQNQKFSTSGDTYSQGGDDYSSGYDGLNDVINEHTDDGASDAAEKARKYNENLVVDDEGNTSIRYDNEETFFKTLEVNDPLLHHRIVDKVKYFDPAFHSITPEGFAARLTFLHQCTRQGNTVGASDTMNGNDKKVTTATNLAFGRPPICVLRVGDFYNTKIIIDSLSINYENGSGIQWDMNLEGIGMMPMFAKIDINFKFIGGSDLTGPINRLQNAVSFNYYANTRVYDNRSDGIEYDDEGNVKKITAWKPYSNNKK